MHDPADDYTVEIFFSNEDDAYVAIAPDLPGCSAVGDTRAEALAEMEDAMVAWFHAMHKAGNPLPLPTRHPTLK
jgi:predicted RNase H-like HicB family nuclease